MNKSYRISPHEVLHSCLITNTVYLLIWLWKIRGEGQVGLKEKEREGGGGGLITFFLWKGGGGLIGRGVGLIEDLR